MNSHILQIALGVNLALVVSAHYSIKPHTSVFDEHHTNNQERMTTMMRRERPAPETAQEVSANLRHIAVGAPGSQTLSGHRKSVELNTEGEVASSNSAPKKSAVTAPKVETSASPASTHEAASSKSAHHKSAVLARKVEKSAAPASTSGVASSKGAPKKSAAPLPKAEKSAAPASTKSLAKKSAAAASTEAKAAEETPVAREADKGVHQKVEPQSAGLIEEEELSATRLNQGVDEKNRHAKKLSNEDEELYYKLFPEDREVESKEAVSALELSGSKAFKIKVPIEGGEQKLCLTEENHGYGVRAEPCRRSSSRQKWYWMGSKLKNLFSKGRCLGFAKRKHHIAFQTESLLQQEKGKSNAAAHAHHLTMSFHCSDAHAPLGWAVDEHGRLKSASNSMCMAINENDGFDAWLLPCENGVEEQLKQ